MSTPRARMGGQPSKSEAAGSDWASRLSSWKEIAAYLNTSVRTVQRWERTEGLPVVRHEHASVATVYAYPSEVNSWLERRRQPGARRSAEAHPEPARPPLRVLVLPFRLIVRDPEIEFLSFGLADAITVSLSGFQPLVVRSSLLAAKYAAETDFQRIAREAAVDLLLIGSILRSGARIRVSAQLVEAKSGAVICSPVSEADLHDIFVLQDEVVKGVQKAFPTAGIRDKRRLHEDRPANAVAYEYYVRANELAYDFDPAACDLYLRCLEEDPNYAPAWARLGRWRRLMSKFGQDADDFARAEAALKRSISINPDLALAHTQLAYLEADSGRAEQAMVRLLLRATSGEEAELLAGLVHVCRYCGLLDASLRAHEHACRLDPTVRTSVCHTHFLRGDYERALDASKEVLGFIGPMALLALGRTQEAIALARKMEQTGTPLRIVREAFSMVRAVAEGAVDEALTILESMNAHFTQGPEELFYSARCFAHLGRTERAIDSLSRAVEAGFFPYPAIARDPWLHGLLTCRGCESVLDRAREHHRRAVRAFVAVEGDRILHR